MLDKMHTMVDRNVSITSDDIQEFLENHVDISTLSVQDKDIVRQIKLSLKAEKKLPFLFTDQEKNYLLNNSQSIWLEYLIYRFKFKLYPKQRILTKFPIHLLVELTSACNLKCIMCFQSDSSFRTKEYIGHMKFEVLKNVIDQAYKGGTSTISFASRGEPLLYKHFEDALKYVSGKFLEIKINTNATRLDEDKAHTILKYCDNLLLVFSVDSYESESYAKIRVGGDFNKVINNIRKFQEIKKKFYPNVKVITRLSGVILDEKQNLDQLKHFWHREVDEISLEKAELMFDTYHNPLCKIDSHCNYLWENMFVWYDGTCNPCDLDYKSKLKVGNINDSTLSEIWNSEIYNKFRNKHAMGKRAELYPCDRCGVEFS